MIIEKCPVCGGRIVDMVEIDQVIGYGCLDCDFSKETHSVEGSWGEHYRVRLDDYSDSFDDVEISTEPYKPKPQIEDSEEYPF